MYNYIIIIYVLQMRETFDQPLSEGPAKLTSESLLMDME